MLLCQLVAGHKPIQIRDHAAAGAGGLGVVLAALARFQAVFIGLDRAVVVPLGRLDVGIGIADRIARLAHGGIEELQNFAPRAGALGAGSAVGQQDAVLDGPGTRAGAILQIKRIGLQAEGWKQGSRQRQRQHQRGKAFRLFHVVLSVSVVILTADCRKSRSKNISNISL